MAYPPHLLDELARVFCNAALDEFVRARDRANVSAAMKAPTEVLTNDVTISPQVEALDDTSPGLLP